MSESAEKHSFQAEVRQLLHLMIHSMYSNKEIFLRELISNASDACDRLRFAAISRPELLNEELKIELEVDKSARTLTVRDNGIGMTREEAIANLGTIARSGTQRFLESLSGEQKQDAALIGQFGVGFYSAFIVADRVTVLSKAADGAGLRWESDGQGEFQIEAHGKTGRGTEVTLHLREDAAEFAEPYRLRGIVHKYSEHIGLPIRMRPDENKEWDTINQARALWTRPKSELKDEDYAGFYQHLSHDPEPPLAWAHHKVEGGVEYTSLLYLPQRAPFDLFDREQRGGIKLYVKRVFIMDKAAELMPPYLRFVRGLVDSSDLPLNVSRELLQNNRTVEKIRAGLVKRALDLLDELAARRPDDYAKFWAQFGAVLKEGLIEDHANQERIARLCRFCSTSETAEPKVSLEAYVARMPQDQDKIYFLTAETLAGAKGSPHLEGFRRRNYEVLLLGDRVDEWVVEHLREFQNKKLESVARASKDAESKIETPDRARHEAEYREVLERAHKLLSARVQAVRLSARLTESPSCLVAPEQGLSRRLEELLRRAGEKLPASLPILELNPEHPLAERLRAEINEEAFADLAELLYGQAVLAEGGQLEDPAGFVRRLNKLILGQTASRIIV